MAAFSEMAKREDEISILISDNAQDLLSADGAVGLGFDRGAVVRAVTEGLVGKGFGVWLIGVQSEFLGEYFSVKLASGPDGAQVNRRLSLSGRQPFYLWIASRDLERGRSLVGYLERDLSRQLAGDTAGERREVRAIELSPGTRPLISIERPEVPDIERRREILDRDVSKGSASETRGGRGGSRARDYLDVLEWRTGEVEGMRSCTAAPSSRRTLELLYLLKVRLDFDDRRAPWDTLPRDLWILDLPTALPYGAEIRDDLRTPADGAVNPHHYRTIWIPAHGISAVKAADRRLDLPVATYADLGRLPEEHWLAAWSTDDDTTRENVAGRTLFLSDIAERILRTTVGEAHVGACLELWIGQR